MARYTHSPPRVLLADEPTRGIDVGAKRQISDSLRQMADAGIGIVLVSSELEEVIEYCDEIAVLSAGTNRRRA